MSIKRSGQRFEPFRDSELNIVIFNREKELQQKIDNFTDDEILANDENILVDNLYEEFRFVPVELLDEDISQRKMNQRKITVPNQMRAFSDEPRYFEVDGVVIDLRIPFTGEEILFTTTASTIMLSPFPSIALNDGFIELHYEFKLQNGTETRILHDLCDKRDRDIQSLRAGISYANNDVSTFNAGLRDKIHKMLKSKKEKVSSYRTLSQLLQIPVQQNDFAKMHIAVKRRIQPISHRLNRETTYTISDTDYKDILQAIKHIGSSIEQTPASYQSMGEEDFRNVVLGQLNGFYLGQATGETFRKSGKTDIRIEMDNRAAFVAECKMWSGPKKIGEAIDQLDHYLTWRDCKTALIFFVKQKNFLQILDTAKTALCALPNMRQVKEIDKNEFECTYNSDATPGQIISIRCFLFNTEAGTSKR